MSRSTHYGLPTRAPTFDILTLVFETDAAVLRKTATSVIAQDFDGWRWVICDNGSTNAGTREVLAELAQHPRIVVESLQHNLGMVEGHRRGVDLCTADYVAFLDHDDLLTPDALRIVAWHIDRFDCPSFLYSDEDKCDVDDRRFDPLIKPDLDPALLIDTAYPCHLSVVKREQLAACGAFSDAEVEGTQDWDMALRLFESGGAIVHIPEVLYSWRALPTSTASAISSKPYVIDAQRTCLQRHLQRRGLAERFEIVANPLPSALAGHWWIRLRADVAQSSVDFTVLPSRAGELSAECLREAAGLLELVSDAGLIGASRPDERLGRAHFNCCRREVSSVDGPFVARVAALAQLGSIDVSADDLPARLRAAGWRTIGSPFIGTT